MTFDPDRPDAHAEERAAKTSRAPSSDAESRAIERLIECAEVESQLDELLRLPLGQGGERCLLVVEEALGRDGRIAQVLGAQEDDDRASGRLHGAFGLCGTCTIGPERACPRCANGTPHPGEPCTDPRRNRCCRGVAALAALRARILDAAGKSDDAREIRTDMGLNVEAEP